MNSKKRKFPEDATEVEQWASIVGDLMDSSDDEAFEKTLAEINKRQNGLLNEVTELLEKQQVRKNMRSTSKPKTFQVMPEYTDDEFMQEFRICRELFANLAMHLENWEEYINMRSDKRLSTQTYIGAFLMFAGHERMTFRDVSQRLNISRGSVSRIIERTAAFITSLSDIFIQWPNEKDMQQSANYFNAEFGLPHAIGCIGKINIVLEPAPEAKEQYEDGEGYPTLCLQAVCNEEKEFLDVFVALSGGRNDNTFYQNSPICEKISAIKGDYYVLGSARYPPSEHLLTLYKDTGRLTKAQEHYNDKLSAGLQVIEQCFQSLRIRFPQLHYCRIRGMEKLCHFVRACCVIHNLASVDDIDLTPEELSPEDAEKISSETAKGIALRDKICNDLYGNT